MLNYGTRPLLIARPAARPRGAQCGPVIEALTPRLEARQAPGSGRRAAASRRWRRCSWRCAPAGAQGVTGPAAESGVLSVPEILQPGRLTRWPRSAAGHVRRRRRRGGRRARSDHQGPRHRRSRTDRRRLKTDESASGCHLLYVSASEIKQSAALMLSVEGVGVHGERRRWLRGIWRRGQADRQGQPHPLLRSISPPRSAGG